MTSYIRSVAVSILVMLPLSGCIHSSRKVYNEPARVKVSFETEKAGRTFYEMLSKVSLGHPSTESKTEVNLILIDVRRETITGQNQLFNEAVTYCDTNKDQMITELEADLFASSLFANRRK